MSEGRAKVLYLTYLGALEAIPKSQVLPYLLGLSQMAEIHMLTFEKKWLIKDKPEELKNIGKALKEKGIKWYIFLYHKHPVVLSSFFDIFVGSIFSLFLVIRYRISIIHARSYIPIAIGVILKILAFIPGTSQSLKLLYDRRGIMAEDYVEHSGWKQGGFLYRLAWWFEKKAIRTSDAVVVLTERMKRQLSQNIGLKGGVLIKTIPCCVDTNKYNYDNNERTRLRNKFGLNGKFVFIYSGSVGTYNLLTEMFDFFQVATSFIANAHFFILTENKDTVLNMLRERKDINETQISVGYVSSDDVPAYLSMADTGLTFRRDSTTAIAASPTKFAEYLACSLPVISMSKIGDLGEIINSHKIGVTLNSYDKGEYKQAVEKLLFLLKDKEDMKRRCRKFSEDYFSLRHGINVYLDLYSHLS